MNILKSGIRIKRGKYLYTCLRVLGVCGYGKHVAVKHACLCLRILGYVNVVRLVVLISVNTVRKIGLLLFIACLVKVYYLDISGLNTLGKVIAFTVLGILFLGAASAYIFFRKRFDEEKAEDLQEKEEH